MPADVTSYIIAKLCTNAGADYICEYASDVFKNMSMEGRMTVFNMSLEMGARGGMIAPRQTTFEYVRRRKFAQQGDALDKK